MWAAAEQDRVTLSTIPFHTDYDIHIPVLFGSIPIWYPVSIAMWYVSFNRIQLQMQWDQDMWDANRENWRFNSSAECSVSGINVSQWSDVDSCRMWGWFYCCQLSASGVATLGSETRSGLVSMSADVSSITMMDLISIHAVIDFLCWLMFVMSNISTLSLVTAAQCHWCQGQVSRMDQFLLYKHK